MLQARQRTPSQSNDKVAIMAQSFAILPLEKATEGHHEVDFDLYVSCCLFLFTTILTYIHMSALPICIRRMHVLTYCQLSRSLST